MRRVALHAALVSGALVVPLACTDLFHSTADVLTACEIDAATAGCGADLCSTSHDAARQQAYRVCAWLGACEAPLGGNAFGACVFQALLAYDCSANPNHPPRAAARGLWACLAGASSCDAVDQCVFVGGAEPCGMASDRCGEGANAAVHVQCAGGPGAGASGAGAAGPGSGGASSSTRFGAEPCALWGKTCISEGSAAGCGSTGAGLGCEDGGPLARCFGPAGTELHWCGPDASDIGIDCRSNGAQQCGGFPEPDAASWLACLATGDAAPGDGAPGCTPSLDVTCSGGTALSCPSGVPESLDCASLLGSAGACTPGSLDPPFDWTSPCAAAAACPPDSCNGSMLTSCTRGASVGVDCAALGLGACQLVTDGTTAEPRAACSPP